MLLVSSLLVLVFAVIYAEAGAIVPLLVSSNGISAMLLVAALALRQSRSLSYSLLLACGLSVLMIVGTYLVFADASLWWHDKVSLVAQPLLDSMAQYPDELAQHQLQVDHIANYIGWFGAGVLTYIVICLFIARWWQSMLFNPGGFRTEFHELRTGKSIAIAAVVLALVSILDLHPELTRLVQNVLIIIAPLYLLQGLSVIHALVALKKLQAAWLVMIYIVIFFMLPAVVMLGYLDRWVDIRRRFGGKPTDT
ncbi:MAG: DUF2232 domain-containing protein, partial [Thiohalomonadales bacterium]